MSYRGGLNCGSNTVVLWPSNKVASLISIHSVCSDLGLDEKWLGDRFIMNNCVQEEHAGGRAAPLLTIYGIFEIAI